MITNTNKTAGEGTRILVDIPLQDTRLFNGEATNDVLTFLLRHRNESFSMTDLATAVDYTRPTITKTIDILLSNDLVEEERDGPRRLVQINRARVQVPDDPVFEIPQADFHAPVQAATEALRDELDDVLGIVLYGSVARGRADRRSDIDLWVLVREDRMGNQRRANQVRESLQADRFDGERYAFEIDVEGLQAVPSYVEELQEILRDGIVLYRTDEFETVQRMVLSGASDE